MYNLQKNTIHIISLSCNTVPPSKYGGIELVIAHLCEGLSNLGCKVVCYSPGKLNLPGVIHWKTLDEPSVHIKDGGSPNTEEHLKSVLIGLTKNLKFGDVIVFNHADQFRYLKKHLGLLAKWKYFLCEIAHWLDVGVYKNVIYPSKELKLLIKKPGTVIPHGEKLLFQYGEIFREDFLFFAGRITKDKGVDIALQAAARIGVKLVLAGPLNDKKFAEKIINDKNVKYLGELTYKELFNYYCRAKCLVYMTQYTEPFGLSVIEAMAAGCPVITTGKGGTGETVINSKTGYFCNNSDEIYQAYFNLDKIKSEDCIKRAEEYTLDHMAKSYLNYFLS